MKVTVIFELDEAALESIAMYHNHSLGRRATQKQVKLFVHAIVQGQVEDLKDEYDKRVSDPSLKRGDVVPLQNQERRIYVIYSMRVA